MQDLPTIINSPESGAQEDEYDLSAYDQTNITILKEEDNSNAKDASYDEEVPITESTIISNGETTLTEDQNETTDADRSHNVTQKRRKIRIVKQTTKLNKKMKTSCCSFVTDVAVVDVSGKWMNVSD